MRKIKCSPAPNRQPIRLRPSADIPKAKLGGISVGKGEGVKVNVAGEVAVAVLVLVGVAVMGVNVGVGLDVDVGIGVDVDVWVGLGKAASVGRGISVTKVCWQAARDRSMITSVSRLIIFVGGGGCWRI